MPRFPEARGDDVMALFFRREMRAGHPGSISPTSMFFLRVNISAAVTEGTRPNLQSERERQPVMDTCRRTDMKSVETAGFQTGKTDFAWTLPLKCDMLLPQPKKNSHFAT